MSVTGDVGVRAQQRQQTTAIIEHAALTLFGEHGFDSVTAEEIAAAAGVSRRTFFRYFPGGKEEVLLADLRRHMDAVEQTMASRPPQEPALTALRASFAEMATRYEEDREDALLRARIMEGSPALAARGFGEWMRLIAAVTHMVALRMAADPTTDLRPGVIATTSIAAVQVAVGAWLRSAIDLAEAVDTALDIVEGGLGAAAQRQALAG